MLRCRALLISSKPLWSRRSGVTARCAFAAHSRPARSRSPSAGSSGTSPRRVPRALVASRPGRPGTVLRGLLQLAADSRVEELARSSAAAEIAGLLTGSTSVRFYHDHVLVKEPGTVQRTPWHQDQPYYNVDGAQTCSVWLPVDPVSRAATPRVRRRLAPRPVADAAHVHGQRGEVVSRGEPRRSARHRGEPRRVRHRRLGARARRRRVLQHADAALRRRGRGAAPATRPVASLRRRRRHACAAGVEDLAGVSGLADELPAGAPLEHPLFPVVWSR